MRCNQCGAPLKETDKYCSACGAANTEYVEEKKDYSDPFTATKEEFYEKPKRESNYDNRYNDDPFRGNAHRNTYNQRNYDDYSEPPVIDQPGCGLGLLSFMVPIAGFILYFVFKNSNKIKSANHAAKWAWISVGITVAFYIFLTIIGAFSVAEYM